MCQRLPGGTSEWTLLSRGYRGPCATLVPSSARAYPSALTAHRPPRLGLHGRTQASVSSATNAKNAIDSTPLTVKNAASSRRRSFGRTITCSYARSARTTRTPSQYHAPTSRPIPPSAEEQDRPGVHRPRAERRRRDAEPRRPRVEADREVVLAVEERVEQVEAGDPEADRAAEGPRLPRQLARDGRPGADGREAERARARWQSHVTRFRYG